MPRSVLRIVVLLCCLSAALGFWMGQRKPDLADASGLIEKVAEQHVTAFGGDISACLGWFSPEGDLLNVRCGDVLYQVGEDRRIRLVPGDSI